METEKYLKERAKIELFTEEQKAKLRQIDLRLRELQSQNTFFEDLLHREKEIIEVLTSKKYSLVENPWDEVQGEEIDSMVEHIEEMISYFESGLDMINEWIEPYQNEMTELSRQRCLMDMAVQVHDRLLADLLKEYLKSEE